MAKSSFNIFAVRRAFAYGHSLLAAKVRRDNRLESQAAGPRLTWMDGLQERTHESENTAIGGTTLGALISFTRPKEAEVRQSQSSEADEEPARKRARN